MHTRLVIDTNRLILTILIFISKCILPNVHVRVGSYLASLIRKSVILVKLKVNGRRKPFRYIISIWMAPSLLHSHVSHTSHKSPETYCQWLILVFFLFFAQKWFRHRQFWSACVGRVSNWDGIHHLMGPIRKIHQIHQRKLELIHQNLQSRTEIKAMHLMRRYDCIKFFFHLSSTNELPLNSDTAPTNQLLYVWLCQLRLDSVCRRVGHETTRWDFFSPWYHNERGRRPKYAIVPRNGTSDA